MKNNNIAIGLVVVVAFVVLGFIIFTGGDRETTIIKEEKIVLGEYDTFAQCLYESGLRMYGSVTCSVCARQRKLFGDSFHFIREIECDPRNNVEEAKLCVPKNITHTPTWIHEDKDGNELFRFEAGLQSLDKLAEISGCPLVKDDLTEL